MISLDITFDVVELAGSYYGYEHVLQLFVVTVSQPEPVSKTISVYMPLLPIYNAPVYVTCIEFFRSMFIAGTK